VGYLPIDYWQYLLIYQWVFLPLQVLNVITWVRTSFFQITPYYYFCTEHVIMTPHLSLLTTILTVYILQSITSSRGSMSLMPISPPKLKVGSSTRRYVRYYGSSSNHSSTPYAHLQSIPNNQQNGSLSTLHALFCLTFLYFTHGVFVDYCTLF